MPCYLIKLAENEYVEWSTIVDAPVSPVMDREAAIVFSIGYAERRQPIEEARAEAQERLGRTDRNGHSAMWFGPETAEELVRFNRAGERETRLTLEQIREQYKE